MIKLDGVSPKQEQGLKPCPFCGGEVTIAICDDEGNFRNEEYEQNPWSGLGYVLCHEEDDNPNCPIANFRFSQLGIMIYDTREEAAEAWNRRSDNG